MIALRRVEPEPSRLGRQQPGEHAQQRRLARAVRADQADDVARRDDQVQPGEQRPIAVTGRELLHHERGAHSVTSAVLSYPAHIVSERASPDSWE